jgi:hypothetical protein
MRPQAFFATRFKAQGASSGVRCGVVGQRVSFEFGLFNSGTLFLHEVFHLVEQELWVQAVIRLSDLHLRLSTLTFIIKLSIAIGGSQLEVGS